MSSVSVIDAIGQIVGAIVLLFWAILRTAAKIFDYLFRIAMSVLNH